MTRGPYPGWQLDPDPLDVPEPEPPPTVKPGCIHIVTLLLVLILALSGVPGVVASVPTPSEAPENRMGDAAGRTLAGAGGPAQGLRGAPDATLAVVDGRAAADPEWPAGAPTPTSGIATQIYTASATWCAPTPDKCQGWGGNARLAAVNSFTWGDEPYPVRVWRGEMYVDAMVVSHCGCFGKDGYIDLSPAAWKVLEPDLGIGRIDVEVEVLVDLPPHKDDDRMRAEDGGPAATVPPTSTEDTWTP